MRLCVHPESPYEFDQLEFNPRILAIIIYSCFDVLYLGANFRKYSLITCMKANAPSTLYLRYEDSIQF